MWSLGCILHILLCGKVPFSNFNSTVQDRKILEGKWDMKGQVRAQNDMSHSLSCTVQACHTSCHLQGACCILHLIAHHHACLPCWGCLGPHRLHDCSNIPAASLHNMRSSKLCWHVPKNEQSVGPPAVPPQHANMHAFNTQHARRSGSACQSWPKTC